VIAENPLLAAPAVSTDPDDLCGIVLADRYRLLRILGRGGMGYVYLAEHVQLGGQLAVKLLSSALAKEAQYRERFLREARSASSIAHENVVTVTDFGETPNGSAFLAMELLEGEDLSEVIARDGALPWLRTKRVILQVCRALHAAHEKGIVHRDVKPENCFRVKRGANRDFIKVLDFGIAKIVGDETKPQESFTRRGEVFGTPEYMSPEQARGRKVDARSDIYAVGVMLYELTTGTLPFVGETFMDVLTRQCTEAPVLPLAANPRADVPGPLQDAIMKCLEKDPAARFASIRELAECLAEIPVGPPAVAVSGSGAGPATPSNRIYLVTIAILLATVVMLAGALAAALALPR
jgi:serine/threonine-protein kinase